MSTAQLQPLASLLCACLQVTLVDKSDRFVFKPLLYELINGAARTEEVAPLYTQLLNSSTTRFVQVRLVCTMALAHAVQHHNAFWEGYRQCRQCFAGHSGGCGGRQPHSRRRKRWGCALQGFAEHCVPTRAPACTGSVGFEGPAQHHTDDNHCAGGRIRLQGGSVLEYDWLVLAVGSQTNTFGIEGVKEHAVTFWSLDDVAQVPLRVLDPTPAVLCCTGAVSWPSEPPLSY